MLPDHTPGTKVFKVPELRSTGSSAKSQSILRLLQELLEIGVVHHEEWDEIGSDVRDSYSHLLRDEDLYQALLSHRLITQYQAKILRKGLILQLIVGQYRILEPLGQGGMGTVYLAEHIYLRKQVALKVMGANFASDTRAVGRFFQEARAVARLQHPNIVFCFDAGRYELNSLEDSERFYYAMEHVRGDSLDHYIRQYGPLSVGRAAGIFAQIADALAEAHRHKLIHRDIKPHNIMLTHDLRAKLLDFGLAQHPNYQFTSPGAMLGTVGFMAPEQATDPREVDARADLYSLGATLFRAVTGQDPFPDTGSPLADLRYRTHANSPDPSEANPSLPREFCSIITRLMQLNPDHRYQSASDVVAALVPFLCHDEKSALVDLPRCSILVFSEDEPQAPGLIAGLGSQVECLVVAPDTFLQDSRTSTAYDIIVVLSPPTIEQLQPLLETAPGMVRPYVLLYTSPTRNAQRVPTLIHCADDLLRGTHELDGLNERVRGALRVRNARPSTNITENDERILTTRLTNSQVSERPFLPGVAEILNAVLEEFELKPSGYSRRIDQYITWMVEECRNNNIYANCWDEAFVGILRCAAKFHDIGLLGVPRDLLASTSVLSPDDKLTYESHVAFGADLVTLLKDRFPEHTAEFKQISEIILYHHENWNGTGYPCGIAETAIPLGSRLLGIVNSYDALRTRSPIRPGFQHNQVVERLRVAAGNEFDPNLIVGFLSIASKFDEIFSSVKRNS